MSEFLYEGVLLPFISDPILEFIFIFVISSAAAALLLIFIFRRIRRYGSFSYTNARISAMKGSLFRKEKLDQLVEARDLQNLISHLEGSHYSSYLENLEDFTPQTLENSIYKHQANSYRKITRLAPEEVRGIFQEMERILEIKNLEAILAGKLENRSREEIERRLTTKRYIAEDVYEKLIEAESIGEAITAFEGTRYWETIDEAVSEYGETGKMLPVWFGLESKYWEETWKTAKSSSADYSDIIQKGIGMKIDVFNILFILRCKFEGINPEEIEKYTIPIHSGVEAQDISRARESEDLEGTVLAFEGTPYGEALSEALPQSQESGSIFPLEKALEEELLKKLRKLSIQHYSYAGPITAFFQEKEVEVKNLVRIINGKAHDLNSEEIRNKLIAPEVED